LISAIALCTACGQQPNEEYLKIEKCVPAHGQERLVYYKIFNSNHNLLVYKEGNANTTDSIVYTYDKNFKIINSEEFRPDRGEAIYKVKQATMLDDVRADEKQFFDNPFHLIDDSNLKDADRIYHDSLIVKSFESDSGKVKKYRFGIHEAMFLLLPFSSNNQGEEGSDILDSLVITCINNKLLSEDYYFTSQLITRKYFYAHDRLVKIVTQTNDDEARDNEQVIIFKYIKLKED
jgi:hypothetical protein